MKSQKDMCRYNTRSICGNMKLPNDFYFCQGHECPYFESQREYDLRTENVQLKYIIDQLQKEQNEKEVVAMSVRARGTDHAKVIQVIETVSLLGSGTEQDPLRMVRQYWSFEGCLLASSEQPVDWGYDAGMKKAVDDLEQD